MMRRRQGLTAIDGVMALMVLLLIVQMWLFSATLETWLAGHGEAALPAAIVSGVIFASCAGLYVFVVRIDAETRK